MTVQRRLLIWLTLIAAAVWVVALLGSYWFARAEVDELFDTRQLTLAAQVLAQLPGNGQSADRAVAALTDADKGAAEPEDIIIAVWNRNGEPLFPGAAEHKLSFNWNRNGFVTESIAGEDWRVFYLRGRNPERLIAVAQTLEERTEVLWELLGAELFPFLATLPILVAGIALAVHRSFAPLRGLAAGLKRRTADDLEPIPTTDVPKDVAPLIESLNSLFGRIQSAMEYERRLTADASHELRTPIAGLKAQWDAWRLARDEPSRERAASQMGKTIDRLSRLVSQLLSLSALEREHVPRSFSRAEWPLIVENALSDVLPLMDSRAGEIDVEWPEGDAAIPLRGDNALLSIMLRNLLDNSLLYGSQGVRILVRFSSNKIEVLDNGPGVPADVTGRIGSRFYRPAGQTQAGSGIGLSIVLRIARLHQLDVQFERSTEPVYTGACVTISPSEVAQ